MATTQRKSNAKPGTALANYDEELARQAAEYAQQEESAGGGQFFSVKGGLLTFAGATIPNNHMAVVVIDSIMENAYYEGKFESDNPQPPKCFAFGRSEDDMSPHSVVSNAGNAQNETCGRSGQSGCCEWNEWGSSDTGRGKACKNTRRLLLLSAPGELDIRGKFDMNAEDPRDYLERTAPGFMRLSVTSVKNWANYVKQLNGALHLPPHAMFTKVSVVPDSSDQFKIVFEPLDKIPKDLLPAIMQRHAEARALIEQPYPVPEEEQQARPARGRVAKAPPKKAPAAKARGR